MSTIVVAAQFTQAAGQPAVGLALADIDLFLTRVHLVTGVDTVVWDGTQHPTAEIDNVGSYGRLYTAADLNTYTYFCMGQYTGAAVLDTDYVMGAVGTDAAAIWTYITRTLTSVSTAPGVGLTATTWRVLRGDTLSRTFATIAADPTLTKCQVTVKHKDTDADSAAVLAVDSTTGLLRLNGAAPGAFTATFVLATGVLTVPANVMAQIDRHTFDYDVQVWVGATVTTIEQGTFEVTNDITATVTP